MISRFTSRAKPVERQAPSIQPLIGDGFSILQKPVRWRSLLLCACFGAGGRFGARLRSRWASFSPASANGLHGLRARLRGVGLRLLGGGQEVLRLRVRLLRSLASAAICCASSSVGLTTPMRTSLRAEVLAQVVRPSPSMFAMISRRGRLRSPGRW
jgi:hypothetical protein